MYDPNIINRLNIKKISNEYDLILVDDLSRGSLKFVPKKYKKTFR